MTDYLHPGKTTTGQFITQNQHSSCSMSSSRNSVESCYLGVWLFHDNAPAHKSLVAQQALCNCEFVQLNHPAYSLDLTPSDYFGTYFLIRNLKYSLSGTWFIDDESLKIAVKAWSESQNGKLYFQGINSWEQTLKICTDVAREYVKNDSMLWRGQERSTTSRQCWTNSIGCPWYSVCASLTT